MFLSSIAESHKKNLAIGIGIGGITLLVRTRQIKKKLRGKKLKEDYG
jgi:hypothetical protein